MQGLQVQMSTLQIIGHNFCQVLLKLADQDFKPTDNAMPYEDLYASNENYSQEQWLEIRKLFIQIFSFLLFLFLVRLMVIKKVAVLQQFLRHHHHRVAHYRLLMKEFVKENNIEVPVIFLLFSYCAEQCYNKNVQSCLYFIPFACNEQN